MARISADCAHAKATALMNGLLLWMSARQSGSAQSFRSQVAALGSVSGRSPHRVAEWNLSKLGHAEFGRAAVGEGWRVAPPVLAAGDPSKSGHALLCGARTPVLLDRLRTAAGPRLLTSTQNGGPDVVALAASSSVILGIIAQEAGIDVQWNAPLAVLACSPKPSANRLDPADISVGGWDVSRFSKSNLAWVPSTVADARGTRDGFFRFRSDYSTKYILIEAGSPFVTDSAAGKYRLLARRHRRLRRGQSPITYTSSAEVIRIRASCRPPALVERALVLCSGSLPRFDNEFLAYGGVEPAVASAVAALLDQRFQ
jgi:hypothetical protein